MSYSRGSNSFWARSWSFLKMGAWPEKGDQLLAHRGVWERWRAWKYMFPQCTTRKRALITLKPSPIDPGWNFTASLWCGDFFESIWSQRYNHFNFPFTGPLGPYRWPKKRKVQLLYNHKASNADKLKMLYFRSQMESKKSPHHKEDVKFHSGSIGEGFRVIRALLRVVHQGNL